MNSGVLIHRVLGSGLAFAHFCQRPETAQTILSLLVRVLGWGAPDRKPALKAPSNIPGVVSNCSLALEKGLKDLPVRSDKDKGGWEVLYRYDEAGRLTAIGNILGSFSFEYDLLGRRTKARYPNGTETAFAYDPAHNLTEIASTLGGRAVSRNAYTYDPIGNRLTNTDLKGERSYRYDALSQLLQTLEKKKVIEAFAWDPAGNRLREGGKKAVAYTYGPGNRIQTRDGVQYAHDPNGNLVRKAGKKEGTTRYEYDWENRLKKVTMSDGSEYAFAYDPFGRRVRREATGHGPLQTVGYFYDGPNVLYEYAHDGVPDTVYAHDLGVDLPLAAGSGGQTYYNIITGTAWAASSR